MYKFGDYTPLNKDEIFKRVSQEDIFKIVFNQNIVMERLYTSPFRSDETPGCFFWKGDETGKLFFVDFGDSKSHRDCFNVLQDYYDISFEESMKLVNLYFGLGLGDDPRITKETVICCNEEDKKNEHKQRVITYVPRPFENKDRIFWTKYEISKQNLIDDGVIPLEMYSSISKKNEKYTIRPIDIAYAFTEFNEERNKIYRPYAGKKQKWLSTCTKNDIGSITHLPWIGEILIITKSYKDCRVIRNQGYNSVWFQNEGMIPDNDIIISLCKRFERIYVLYDNDNAGIKAGKKVTDTINSLFPGKCMHIFLPEKYLELNIKDASDLISFNKLYLLNFLNENIK